MAIKFENRLKGRITQALASDVLSLAGYRVTPLGVEQVILEVQNLPHEQYRKLDLPHNLRTLPDFFISDGDMTSSIMLEVKYRRQWDEKSQLDLMNTLLQQTAHWDPLYVAIFLGNPCGKGKSHSDYMRIAKLSYNHDEKLLYHGSTEDKASQIGFISTAWKDLWTFEETFTKIPESMKPQMMKVARLVSSLTNLDHTD